MDMTRQQKRARAFAKEWNGLKRTDGTPFIDRHDCFINRRMRRRWARARAQRFLGVA